MRARNIHSPVAKPIATVTASGIWKCWISSITGSLLQEAVAPAGAERSRLVEASAGGDSLRLTGEATSLQAMQRELSTAPAIDHARVQAVREALQAGTYKINAEAIADGMLGLEGQLGG